MSLSTRHPLRKSCGFCRARKIKCSNETICEACRKQNVDCIYDFEPARSSASGSGTGTATGSGPNSGGGGGGASDAGRNTETTSRNINDVATFSASTSPSATTSSPRPSSSSSSSVLGADRVGQDPGGGNVASQLDAMFHELFSSNNTATSANPCRESISSYNKAVRTPIRPSPVDSFSPIPLSPSNCNYNNSSNPDTVKSGRVLSLITQDLVGLVVARFGMLGCHYIEGGGARMFIEGLKKDNTETMFDPATPGGINPLTEYGSRKISQTIDVWFSIHPLSFLVSKTLLLHELRAGTHDEILLAVLLADANFFIGDDVAVARGHVLLRWATSKLGTRQSSKYGSPQQGMVHPGISICQALTLLGWNALCQSQTRRATCFIGLAGKLASEIKDAMPSAPSATSSSRINGIEVFEVEKEMLAYLWWTTFSLTLWSFMQMGHQQQHMVPTNLTSIFLPVDETSSVLIRLDEVSDNLSTLQKQKTMIREMWPLAHVSSIVAHIHALYPQETDQRDSMGSSPWQEAPLLALQRIRKRCSSQGVVSVCREVYHVLMQSIQILNTQVAHAPSRTLVLVLYHTMAIHFLFPKIPAAAYEYPLAEQLPLTPESLEKFCNSAEEIYAILASIAASPQDSVSLLPLQTHSSFPDASTLSLDTCSRSLSYIYTRMTFDMQAIRLYENRLETLTAHLHQVAQSEFLNPRISLRVVKKSLKSIIRGVGFASPTPTRSIPSSLSTSALSGTAGGGEDVIMGGGAGNRSGPTTISACATMQGHDGGMSEKRSSGGLSSPTPSRHQALHNVITFPFPWIGPGGGGTLAKGRGASGKATPSLSASLDGTGSGGDTTGARPSGSHPSSSHDGAEDQHHDHSQHQDIQLNRFIMDHEKAQAAEDAVMAGLAVTSPTTTTPGGLSTTPASLMDVGWYSGGTGDMDFDMGMNQVNNWPLWPQWSGNEPRVT